MITLIIPNDHELLAREEKTKFSSDISTGVAVLPADNGLGFTVNNFVVTGKEGKETTELLKIVTPATAQITVATSTLFEHKEDDPITEFAYDQVSVEWSATKTGTFAALTSSPYNVEVDNPIGTIVEDDNPNAHTRWYRYRFYNSARTLYSAYTDLPIKGNETEFYTSCWRVRRESGFTENQFIPREMVESYREEAHNEVDGVLKNYYIIPLVPVPAIIRHAETLLASGTLLAKEYGMEADVELGKSGQRKIDRANKILEQIMNNELVLVDSDGNPLPKVTTNQMSYSNVYSASGSKDKGEMFNLGDENFTMKDPDEPQS